MKQKIEQLYLDYFNSCMTLTRFAEYHNISERKACLIINIGRRLNHAR